MDIRTSDVDTSQRILNAILFEIEAPIHRHEDTSELVICLCEKLYEIIYEESVGDAAKKFIFRELARLCYD